MTKNQHIDYWINSADEDLITAQALFEAGRYSWCLFISHLIIEKALKAHYILGNEDNYPPKIHDLLRLCSFINLPFSEEQLLFLDIINKYNMEARYPDIKENFAQLCTQEYTYSNFTKIKDLFRWLKFLLKY
jgi:HEPN domain-containing protein